MSLSNLENLVKANKLKVEEFEQNEFLGLVKLGKSRLKDANNSQLAYASRFDLAYNAAHSLALAALRRHGYRPGDRYIVFQVLPHTLDVGPEIWRILAKCHDVRNVAEYEGHLEIDEQLLNELLEVVALLLEKLEKLVI